jgi:hypothetical protein
LLFAASHVHNWCKNRIGRKHKADHPQSKAAPTGGFNYRLTALGHNVRMPDEHIRTLRQADQARTDFALIEGHFEFIAGQLAQRPTRGDLAKTALGIIFCSAVLTTLFVWSAWH